MDVSGAGDAGAGPELRLTPAVAASASALDKDFRNMYRTNAYFTWTAETSTLRQMTIKRVYIDIASLAALCVFAAYLLSPLFA